ncbi:MAG: YraN family protein [Planctomycetaceae bacterium]|nr:YraN family protein [Planctomycetaceae bacterium]
MSRWQQWFSLFWFRRPERLGARGERLAARFLRQRGMRILARNHRNRLGEIDLIALDQRTIVFVEVRTRTGSHHGLPAETISLKKQETLTRAALCFLKKHGWLDSPARFDVVTIVWGNPEATEEIQHIPNAFPARE